MNALDMIKKIDGIEEEAMNSIIERYKKGNIDILTVDELEELIKENNDVSYLEYAEQLQPQHTHLINDSMSDDFWFVSI